VDDELAIGGSVSSRSATRVELEHRNLDRSRGPRRHSQTMTRRGGWGGILANYARVAAEDQ